MLNAKMTKAAQAMLGRGKKTAVRAALIGAATLAPVAAAMAQSTGDGGDPSANYSGVDTLTSSYVVGLVQTYGVKFVAVSFAVTGVGVIWRWAHKAFH